MEDRPMDFFAEGTCQDGEVFSSRMGDLKKNLEALRHRNSERLRQASELTSMSDAHDISTNGVSDAPMSGFASMFDRESPKAIKFGSRSDLASHGTGDARAVDPPMSISSSVLGASDYALPELSAFATRSWDLDALKLGESLSKPRPVPSDSLLFLRSNEAPLEKHKDSLSVESTPAMAPSLSPLEALEGRSSPIDGNTGTRVALEVSALEQRARAAEVRQRRAEDALATEKERLREVSELLKTAQAERQRAKEELAQERQRIEAADKTVQLQMREFQMGLEVMITECAGVPDFLPPKGCNPNSPLETLAAAGRAAKKLYNENRRLTEMNAMLAGEAKGTRAELVRTVEGLADKASMLERVLESNTTTTDAIVESNKDTPLTRLRAEHEALARARDVEKAAAEQGDFERIVRMKERSSMEQIGLTSWRWPDRRDGTVKHSNGLALWAASAMPGAASGQDDAAAVLEAAEAAESARVEAEAGKIALFKLPTASELWETSSESTTRASTTSQCTITAGLRTFGANFGARSAGSRDATKASLLSRTSAMATGDKIASSLQRMRSHSPIHVTASSPPSRPALDFSSPGMANSTSGCAWPHDSGQQRELSRKLASLTGQRACMPPMRT